jgi:transcription antitermination factor NusB
VNHKGPSNEKSATQDSNKTPGREFALKFLFQLFLKENADLKESILGGNITSDDLLLKIEDFKESYTVPDDEHENNQIDDGNFFFATKLIKGVSSHASQLEQLITAETGRANLDQIDKIERCILMVGCEELFYFETPYQVIINELVTLAKTYGGEHSGRLINGVLDGIRAKR